MEDARLSLLERMARNITMEYQRRGSVFEGYKQMLSIWKESTPAEQQILQRYISHLWVASKKSGAKVGNPPVAEVAGATHAGDVSIE